MNYHITVLLQEAVDALRIQPSGVYVDVTFGGGGHSRLIISQLDADSKLYGFDQDADARRNLPLDEPRFHFVNHNFREIKRLLRLEGVRSVDGILADLGVSSHQLDDAERGFSYRFDAALDMRMNQSDGKTAADILNRAPAEELQRIFSEYGEVRNSRTLAQAVVQARSGKKFKNINDFLAVSDPLSMGESVGISRAFAEARNEELQNVCLWCDEFFKNYFDIETMSSRFAP